MMTMINKKTDCGKKETLLLLILLVSVCLNLVLGVMSGIEPGVKGGKHFPAFAMSGPHGELMVDRLTHDLNTADAAAFRAIVQPQADTLKQAHDKVHEAMKNVAAVYGQEPVDPAALQNALGQLKQAKIAVDDIVAGIIVDSSAKLSTDGRRHLADTSH